MLKQLRLIDDLTAEGRREFTFKEAVDSLKASPTATANTLRRLETNGLIDHVAHGVYAIRPLGSLGTSAVTESLPSAVAALFHGVEHRIAYASALAEHGLLTNPVRTVRVAVPRQVRRAKIGRRPLRLVIERSSLIHLGAEPLGPSWISSLERALIECAMRLDLAGGVERLAEAVAVGGFNADPDRIGSLAAALGARGRAAERRLASLCHAIGMPLDLSPDVSKDSPYIRLDPSEERVVWKDERFRVTWHLTVDEIGGVVGS